MATRSAVPVVEFRIADANAVYRGVSLDSLMAGAGRAVASEVRRGRRKATPDIVIFCGKGNNGGDGFVAARELAPHARVTVVLAESAARIDGASPASRAYKAIAADASIVKVVWSDAKRAEIRAKAAGVDVILDCLLGSGIQGPPRAPYGDIIAMLNTLDTQVVSVDVPSGFPFKPAVHPGVTVTIEAPKQGMTRSNSGRIITVPIGFPPEAWTHTGPGELLLVPRPSDFADKRGRGVLAVIAGGPYSGAPAIVALAAHAAGVGLVHVYTPSNVADIVRRFDPTLVVHALDGSELRPDHIPFLVEDIAKRGCAALALGPGIGRGKLALAAVPRILEVCTLPTVVDADALAAAPRASLTHAVLTPHSGEFQRLTGKPAGRPDDVAARSRAAASAASSLHTTVLLKGHITVVTDGHRTKLNDAGTSAMAVGGAGDVLTGIIGSFLAKGMSLYDAARAAAFAAGKAGELAFESRGHSLKATDLIDALPRVLSRYIPWWGGKP